MEVLDGHYKHEFSGDEAMFPMLELFITAESSYSQVPHFCWASLSFALKNSVGLPSSLSSTPNPIMDASISTSNAF